MISGNIICFPLVASISAEEASDVKFHRLDSAIGCTDIHRRMLVGANQNDRFVVWFFRHHTIDASTALLSHIVCTDVASQTATVQFDMHARLNHRRG